MPIYVVANRQKAHAVYVVDMSKQINIYRKNVIFPLFCYEIKVRDHEIFLDDSFSDSPKSWLNSALLLITLLSSVELVLGLFVLKKCVTTF